MHEAETLIKAAAPSPRRSLDEDALIRRVEVLRQRRVTGAVAGVSLAVVLVALLAVNVQSLTVELTTPPADRPAATGLPADGGPPIADRQPTVETAPAQGFAVAGVADPSVTVPGQLPAVVFDNVGQVAVEAPGRMGLQRWNGEAWEPVDGGGQLELSILYTVQPGDQLRLQLDSFVLPHVDLPLGWYRASMTFSQSGEAPLPGRAVRTIYVPFEIQQESGAGTHG